LKERNNESNDVNESDEVKKNNERNGINKVNKTSKNSKKKIQVDINALNETENIYQNQILLSIFRNDKTINLTTSVLFIKGILFHSQRH